MKTNQNQHHPVTDQSLTQTINIYFRNVRKEARLVPVYTPTTTKELTIVASLGFNIPQERIILFYNGFRIDNYNLPITLTQRSIIHVMDRRNFEFQEIVVNFRPLWNAPSLKLTCSPQYFVREVIDQFLVTRLQMPENKFFLVYAGKILNRSNKLCQEFIEDGGEVTVVLFKTQKEIFNKIAFEKNTQKKFQHNAQNSKTNCPVTYYTTLSALNKKSQQQSALQASQIVINQSNQAAPKPSPPSLVPLNYNQSNISNPLGLSMINISKIEDKESKNSEKIAPSSMSPASSSSSQKGASPSKIQSAQALKNKSGSNGSSNSKNENEPSTPKDIESQQAKPKAKKESQQKMKHKDQKILLLESFYGTEVKNKESGGSKSPSQKPVQQSAAPE